MLVRRMRENRCCINKNKLLAALCGHSPKGTAMVKGKVLSYILSSLRYEAPPEEARSFHWGQCVPSLDDNRVVIEIETFFQLMLSGNSWGHGREWKPCCLIFPILSTYCTCRPPLCFTLRWPSSNYTTRLLYSCDEYHIQWDQFNRDTFDEHRILLDQFYSRDTFRPAIISFWLITSLKSYIEM